MSSQFKGNIDRFDPYKNFRFVVYFDNRAVAGVSKVGALRRTTEVIEIKEGANANTLKGCGRTSYEPIVLERGVTHDREFEEWASAAHEIKNRYAEVSLERLRKDIQIELRNESGQPVHKYTVYECWVSEYQALPELDAAGSGVALETIKVENEGWEREKEPGEGAT